MSRIVITFIAAFLINFAYLFDYLPENKEIDVIDQGEYTFGVIEQFDDEPFERCYYQADTGQQGVFDILPIGRNYTQEAKLTDIITTLGIKSLCQIKLEKATDKGPSKWTITVATFVVANPPTEQNITTAEFTVNFYYSIGLLKYDISVLSEKGFFNHLSTSDIPLESCELQFKNITMEISLQESKPTEHEDPIAKNVISLGQNLCGFKYLKASYDEVNNITWTLIGKGLNGKFYKNSFKSKVVYDFGGYHQTKRVVMGTPVNVLCGLQIFQQFCTLYNPQGQLVVTEECKYYINSFAVEHLGIWKCYSANVDSLETIEYTVNYIVGYESTVEPIVSETATTMQVGCRVANYTMGEMSRCMLTAPNKVPFNIKYGGVTDRYITLGTDYNKAICLLEIKKPLLDFENGFWKCEIIGPNRHDFGGTFMQVGNAKVPEYTKRVKIMAELNRTLLIYCEVPYSTDYCFIIAPNGTKYDNEKKVHINLGKCSLLIPTVYPSDNGTWTCTYARRTGMPNENIIVEVTVTDVLHAYQQVEVDQESNAQLVCHTGGLPLAYCQFIAPNGTIYHVRQEPSSTNVRYYGRGLEYGDCGILLINAQPEDRGYWTCAIGLVRENQKPELRAQIMLEVVPTPEISIAGISVGVVAAVGVAIVGVGVFIITVRRRRNHTEIRPQEDLEMQEHDNVSNSSSSSAPSRNSNSSN